LPHTTVEKERKHIDKVKAEAANLEARATQLNNTTVGTHQWLTEMH